MLSRISREAISDPATGEAGIPLKSLNARTTDDPSVALMDAWACALDVLSFYEERIANEGFIRTAKERLSALELTRTIGYELNPGVAASSYLAFTVEDADDPYREVEVPEGTQVMSVPQESEGQPQIFETIETIEARAEWNEIPARTERDQNLAIFRNTDDDDDVNNGTLYLLDVDNSFDLSGANSDDLVEITFDNLDNFLPVTADLDLRTTLEELEEDAALNPEIEVIIRGIAVDHVQLKGTGLALEAGDRILVVGVVGAADSGDLKVEVVPYRIAAVEESTDYAMTRVDFSPIDLIEELPRPRKVLRVTFRPAVLKFGVVTTRKIEFNQVNAKTLVRRATWRGAALSAFVKTQSWPRVNLMHLFRQPSNVASPAVGTVEPGVYVFRQSVSFFGNTAPKWELQAKYDETRGNSANPQESDPYLKSWEPGGAPRTIWTNSQDVPLTTNDGVDVFLERAVEEIVPGRWALFETPQGDTKAFLVSAAATQSRSDFGLSGKTTGLLLREKDDTDLEAFDSNGVLRDDLEKFTFRTAIARVASEALPLAGIPVLEDLEAGADEVMLDNLYLDLEPGRAVSLGGERSDAEGVEEAETLIVKDVIHSGGFTRIAFESGPEYSYKRATVRVNANVASATHGETVEESLGDGVATRANQAFALAKPPLTHVSAATETGSETTLTIRVNGIVWQEVPSLHDAGPDDRVCMVRIDNDGTTRVVFGDGIHGMRLPTGSLIVTASYRSGMGTDGEVDDETLTLLRTRPLGVRGVTNASRASGAAEAETLEDARSRGPQSVRTLGRIVSLLDYEDFARSFAGIGKALAVALWRGRERIVHVTVAPSTDSVFTDADVTLVNLRDAMNELRDPARPLIVAPHEPRFFQLSARVFHDRSYLADDVEAEVLARLETVFGYDARSLGQPVSAAEVIATIQAVDGVAHVDLDTLEPYRDDDTGVEPSLASVLRAYSARLAESDDPPDVLAAELMTVLPAAIVLSMEAADA
jgi:hypothetical protein